jgi:hypothetical protein
MKPEDVEALAREAGLDDSATLTPYFLQRLGTYSALALEKAAQTFDPNPHAERFNAGIADELRAMAEGLKT